MREKANYRENLEMLSGLFPNKAMVSLQEACDAVGITVVAAYRIDDFPKQRVGRNYKVSIANLARWMS